VHRIFLTCDDAGFCEELRRSLHSEPDFIVCGETKNGMDALKEAMKTLPHLVVVEMEALPGDGLRIAEALKRIMPEVPLFLVTSRNDADAEKEALSRGIDAVFDKESDFAAIMTNARAICGLD
jgi:two-component system, NarL family, response regulator EvgA